MTFGFSMQLNHRIHLSDYLNNHLTDDCNGKFELQIKTNMPFNFDGLGFMALPLAPVVTCKKCGAAYVPRDFQDFVENFFAMQFLTVPKLLTNKQLKFLRLVFEVSQAEVAKLLQIDPTYYSKIESSKAANSLQPGDQLRLKLFYLEKTGFKKAEKLFELNHIDVNGSASIDMDALRETLEPIKKAKLA